MIMIELPSCIGLPNVTCVTTVEIPSFKLSSLLSYLIAQTTITIITNQASCDGTPLSSDNMVAMDCYRAMVIGE